VPNSASGSDEGISVCHASLLPDAVLHSKAVSGHLASHCPIDSFGLRVRILPSDLPPIPLAYAKLHSPSIDTYRGRSALTNRPPFEMYRHLPVAVACRKTAKMAAIKCLNRLPHNEFLNFFYRQVIQARALCLSDRRIPSSTRSNSLPTSSARTRKTK
jgi:hypothetical protein